MQLGECIEETKSCLAYYLWGKKITICVAGTTGAGKTSFCKAFLEKRVLQKERPTIGMKQSKFLKNGIQGTFYDTGGALEYTNIIDFNYRLSNALIFVVDASSPEGLHDAKEMLSSLVYRNKHVKIPMLVACTHNDVEDSETCQTIALELRLDSLIGREISCYSVSSITMSNFGAVEEWVARHAK
ncbi:ADP-ribosylation factor-like protein 8 [Nematocida displodere]|uniref:ADP-ribosylation factor-like protein 8 n=1 Tax=Nematocida displodere TaxID=1805483 RepID=A0A177EIH9_9MICR|nr:ADP-ribosylation factor-like protein 8 [Nematocida displodere]